MYHPTQLFIGLMFFLNPALVAHFDMDEEIGNVVVSSDPVLTLSDTAEIIPGGKRGGALSLQTNDAFATGG